MPPSLSVVIPAFNSKASLELVLRCLELQAVPKDSFECIVVDDGSTDDTRSWLRACRRDLDLRVFSHAVNSGRSAARNTGWEQAKGDTVLFLDADVLPDPHWLGAYAKAFDDATRDAVFGARSCVDLGTASEGLPAAVAAAAAARSEDLFTAGVDAQFAALDRAARPGPYPNAAAERFEREIRVLCATAPDSLLSAYSFVTASVGVRRRWLERLNGFDPSLPVGEDTDFGIRLWEAGGRFTFAPGAKSYHLYRTQQVSHASRVADWLAFFYRHPYRQVLLVNLWFAHHGRPVPNPPSLFADLSTLARLWRDPGSLDMRAEFLRIYGRSLPLDCSYTKEFLVQHYEAESGVPASVSEELLEQALDRGLVCELRNGETYFDFSHTINWLRRCTRFQQLELAGGRYGWLREWTAEREPDAPSERRSPKGQAWELDCTGAVEVTLSRDALSGIGVEGSLQLPLPVGTAFQHDVAIVSCEPPNLLAGLDSGREFVTVAIPPRTTTDFRIRYEFRCRLSERTPRDHEPGGEDLHRFLKPGYPAAHQGRAAAVLDRILGGCARDVLGTARTIYKWMEENTLFLQGLIPDFMILDTGFGACLHRARLFVNLCRLAGIPARERSGALLGRPVTSHAGNRLETQARGFSVFAHTWAEFYVPSAGWHSVELSWGFVRRQLTSLNIADDDLRRRFLDDVGRHSAYYFGHADPFRIEASDRVTSVPTYPVFSGLSPAAAKVLAAHTRHRLTCEVARR
jgi:glycosyltransferase involved in cell wall biosynthesis